MTYRQRLLANRLATEHAHDVASLKRAQLDLIDSFIDEDAASSAEQGSPSPYVVPCYACGCAARRRDGEPSLCVDCQPKPEAHGGPQAPAPVFAPGFNLGAITPPDGWPYCEDVRRNFDLRLNCLASSFAIINVRTNAVIVNPELAARAGRPAGTLIETPYGSHVVQTDINLTGDAMALHWTQLE